MFLYNLMDYTEKNGNPRFHLRGRIIYPSSPLYHSYWYFPTLANRNVSTLNQRSQDAAVHQIKTGISPSSKWSKWSRLGTETSLVVADFR